MENEKLFARNASFRAYFSSLNVVSFDALYSNSGLLVEWKCSSDPSHRFLRSPHAMSTSQCLKCPECALKARNASFEWVVNRFVFPGRIRSKSSKKSAVPLELSKSAIFRCGCRREEMRSVSDVFQDTRCLKCRLSASRQQLVELIHPTMNESGAFDPGALSSMTRSFMWKCTRVPTHSYRNTCSVQLNGIVNLCCQPGNPPAQSKKRHNIAKCPEALLMNRCPKVAARYDSAKNSRAVEGIYCSDVGTFWWTCDTNTPPHSFQSSIYSLISFWKCPICISVNNTVFEKRLRKVHPDISALLHPTRNNRRLMRDITCGASVKLWWVCAVRSDHVFERKLTNQLQLCLKSGKGIYSCRICNSRGQESHVKKVQKVIRKLPEPPEESNSDASFERLLQYSTEEEYSSEEEEEEGEYASVPAQSSGGEEDPKELVFYSNDGEIIRMSSSESV